MIFKTINQESFRKFAAKSPYKSFFQTPEIASLREKRGWTSYYFAVEQDGKLIAASMLVAKPTFLGKSTFYAPGGLLVDYEDKTVLSFFVNHLTKYIKSHNGYVLRIEPYYELIERDRDGNPVANGFNHEKAINNLVSLGFQKTESENPVYAFVLDLKGREEKELFASFKQNTRNLINRTARKGVTVRELKREELPLFKKITESTSERRHFEDKSLDYYETMYDLFANKGEVMFLLAGAKEQSEDTISKHLRGADSQNHNGHGRESCTEIQGRARLSRCDFDDREPSTLRNGTSDCSTPLSAAMFITYGDEVIYLFSGSDEKYMKEYNAQYAIQWYMIRYALSHGFKRYNFYGIQGLPDPDKPGYGIYLFKKGFGGHVTEMLGAYELPANKFFYRLHSLLSKLRRFS